jgi:hypothetical protein
VPSAADSMIHQIVVTHTYIHTYIIHTYIHTYSSEIEYLGIMD